MENLTNGYEFQPKNEFEAEKQKIADVLSQNNLMRQEKSVFEQKIRENEKLIIESVKNLVDVNKIPVIKCNSTDHEYALASGDYYFITNDNTNLSSDTFIESSKNYTIIKSSDGAKLEIPEDLELIEKEDTNELYLYLAQNLDLTDKYKMENKSENYCNTYGPCAAEDKICGRYNECSNIDMDK